MSDKELFYGSYEEKLENLTPTVFGISYQDKDEDNGKPERICKIISNRKDLEFAIQLRTSEGECLNVQDFSQNEFFSISPDSHGVCMITYRLSKDEEMVNSLNIDY